MGYKPRGLYFEDFNIGDEFYSPERTVTQTDIVNFAAFSGDWHPLHCSIEYAKKGPFKDIIAHGMISLAIATGFFTPLGIFDGTTQAFLGLTWKFLKPVYVNDTISLKLVVKEKKKAKSGGRGVVIFDASVINQKGEVVSGGEFQMMQACREA